MPTVRSSLPVPPKRATPRWFQPSRTLPRILNRSASGRARTSTAARATASTGPQVAFVAPSNGGPLNLGIETTDRTGGAGYEGTGNYTLAAGASGFGGTSSATPLAAGIAGLILSRNPGLTRAQVLQIMQNSANKVGPQAYVSGRNDRYGFGRLNALAALQATPLPGVAPTVLTLAATGVTRSGATLNGSVNPNGASTTASFQYGLTTSYGSTVTATPSPGAGSAAVPVSAAIGTLACDQQYHFRATATNATGTTNGSDLTFTTAACFTSLTERIMLGLGPLAGHGGWLTSRNGVDGGFATSTWAQVPWPAYNANGGGMHVAAGDVDGDGLDEIVVGLGPGGAGWIVVFDDAAHGFAVLRWIQVDWPAYNAANGEVWPAVGDIDGDGRAEIVAGLGSGGQGWFEIFDDAAANFAHSAWRQVDWPAYNAGTGATHPAIGNVDGIGGSEIVIGLGSGGGGYLEVFNGAAGGFSHQAWLQVDWPAYNAANGTTFPAAGDLDGDGRAEIVVGLGNGGSGYLEVFDDATCELRARGVAANRLAGVQHRGERRDPSRGRERRQRRARGARRRARPVLDGRWVCRGVRRCRGRLRAQGVVARRLARVQRRRRRDVPGDRHDCAE